MAMRKRSGGDRQEDIWIAHTELAVAVFGLLNPLLTAFIHVTSELAFILNSTRLLPRRSNASRSVVNQGFVTHFEPFLRLPAHATQMEASQK
jgi:hypothetical protein